MRTELLLGLQAAATLHENCKLKTLRPKRTKQLLLYDFHVRQSTLQIIKDSSSEMVHGLSYQNTTAINGPWAIIGLTAHEQVKEQPRQTN